MGWLGGERGYDRNRILTDARRAAQRRSHARAISLYQRVHEVEPENTDVLRRLAAERARGGQREEAWRDYQRAAECLSQRGFVEQAIGVYREAANHLSDEVAVWQALSQLELARERNPDAVEVLVEGRRFFRSRRARQHALTLLQTARRIDPFHFEANFDLAGLLMRSGARQRARHILEALAERTRGSQLRRIRGRLFRLSPSPAAAWRWLSAWAARA